MLKVVGAGFGRTGTTSLKAALEQLGFAPCYHMFELISDPSRSALWEPVLRNEVPDWDTVFDGYLATVDWPGAAYWQELATRYPDAKVLLSERDPDRWYDSMYNTIYQFSLGDGPPGPPPEPGSAEEQRAVAMRAVVRKLIWDGTFHDRFEDRDYAIGVFQRHNARVRAEIPARRLLVHQVGDGWEPLCEFLGVPVPDEEFPHLNDTATMLEMVQQMREDGRLVTPFNE